MFQSIFRAIAIFCLIALIFSPIYLKHIRHYIKNIRIENQTLENITQKTLEQISPNNQQFYRCSAGSTISIPSNNIQIIHFTSAYCHACIDEINDWRELPLQIYKKINNLNTKYHNIEIINILIDDIATEDPSRLFFIKSLMSASLYAKDLISADGQMITSDLILKPIEIYQKINDQGISTCLTTMNSKQLSEFNIDSIPYSLIIYKNKIMHLTTDSGINDIANIVNNLIKKS